ncbi:TetR family transcriptional regulator [Mycolicibacterium sp. J2]|jgi:AcrR family transcriptional regulator|uniref:TetR family transcriptional regulator n=1 Tax=Mycolicibacterium sp. J2 TaxID=2993511 RepID=UPI00224AD3C5|nr:TetR family transcriptional regulator [Mycolicibacterium sp. J2]MCX2715401.1 TetR family transcriptional regulator [Mycolicibacterium sp. J2]
MTRGEQARIAILDAAEQLIAARGAQVPLRDIALAAGQRNNSAVNYYFSNRQELIDAVVRRRLAPMERQRRLMLDALGPDTDVHALLRVLVLPLTAVESDCYASFLRACAVYLPTDTDGAQDSAWGAVLNRLARAVPTTDPSARRRRIAALGTTMFALLAERERSAESVGGVDEIITMLAGMLTAPVSEPALTR